MSETKELLIPEIQIVCQQLHAQSFNKESSTANMLFDFIIRGKFFRATLFRMAALSFGIHNFSDIFSVAMSLELAHSALLIHDDIIDNDDLRRHQFSLHQQWKMKFSSSVREEELGKSAALLSADLLFLYMFSLVSHLPEIVYLFSKELTKTTFGQLSELESSIDDSNERDDIFPMMEYKTGRYTFFLPITAAFLLSKSKESVSDSIKEFSKIAGYLFQIKDDELDLFSCQSIGKTKDRDCINTKNNVCCYEILKRYPDSARLFNSGEYLQETRALYLTSGAKDEITKKIKSLQDILQTILETFPIHGEWRHMWREMIVYLGDRDN